MECTDVTINSGCSGYRLPTEAEWEYASRATTTTAWPYAVSYDSSDDPGQVTDNGFNSNLEGMGWYFFNRTASYANGTKPVARKQANKWGLYDMQGNVWEWCQDWWGDYSGDAIDPQGPVDPSVAYDSARVIRGGQWNNSARIIWSANRFGFKPGERVPHLGFRRVVLIQGQ
jgi:formylglycine-generating enzyme required for sulfatase activity